MSEMEKGYGGARPTRPSFGRGRGLLGHRCRRMDLKNGTAKCASGRRPTGAAKQAMKAISDERLSAKALKLSPGRRRTPLLAGAEILSWEKGQGGAGREVVDPIQRGAQPPTRSRAPAKVGDAQSLSETSGAASPS